MECPICPEVLLDVLWERIDIGKRCWYCPECRQRWYEYTCSPGDLVPGGGDDEGH